MVPGVPPPSPAWGRLRIGFGGPSTAIARRTILHVIRHRTEPLQEVVPEHRGHLLLGESPVHAPHPLVPLRLPDGEGKVSGAEHGVAKTLNVERWATQPSGQEEVQLLPGDPEARGVELPDSGGLGGGIHEVVEAIHELPYGRVSTDEIKMGRGSRFGHGLSPTPPGGRVSISRVPGVAEILPIDPYIPHLPPYIGGDHRGRRPCTIAYRSTRVPVHSRGCFE